MSLVLGVMRCNLYICIIKILIWTINIFIFSFNPNCVLFALAISTLRTRLLISRFPSTKFHYKLSTIQFKLEFKHFNIPEHLTHWLMHDPLLKK